MLCLLLVTLIFNTLNTQDNWYCNQRNEGIEKEN
jgi:hypothetical protein